MSGTWAASMRASLAATLARPAWWALALAAFLLRGGFLVVLLPFVSLPSPGVLANQFAPTIEALALARPSIENALVWTALLTIAGGFLAVLGLAGSWLDLGLAREAAGAEELDDAGLEPTMPTVWRAFGLRLAAHLPTLVALAYAGVRVVVVTYQELLSPGDATVPIALRVIGRAPDAVVLVVIIWLLGEAVGGLAVRQPATIDSVQALRRAIRDLVDRRGVATFVATNLVVLGAAVALVVVAGRANERVRAIVLDRGDAVDLGAALLLLVAVWVLALAVFGAILAWRSTAWSALPMRARGAPVPSPTPVVEELPAG